MKNKNLILLILILGSGILSGFLANETYRLELSFEPPSLTHPFGFDTFGRDLLFLLPFAALKSGLIAGGVGALTTLFSLLFCFILTFLPLWARVISNRILDFLLAFPSLLFALTFASLWTPGWGSLVGSLLVGSIPSFTKLLSARTEEIMKEDFVLAGHSVGQTSFGLYTSHVLPHLTDWLKVKLPTLLSGLILSEAALTFLGVGAPVGSETLGSLLSQGRDHLLEAPHVLMVSGIPLFLMTRLLLVR